MEVSRSQVSTGEKSGGAVHPQEESSLSNSEQPSYSPQQQQTPCSQKQYGSPRPKQTKRFRHERKRFRLQKKNVQETDAPEREKSTWASGSSESTASASGGKATEVSSSTTSALTCSVEAQESTPKQKRERKPQKPGKYVCTYCGRACAKPSVLQKHIRSHTGERPYPCAPCGFSFKTKSNLYKHRKSHTHRVKAGLASGMEGPGVSCPEEPVTESDEESGQTSSSFTVKNQGMISSQRTSCTEVSPKVQSQEMEHSHAVKKRLAMRLSRGRQAPVSSSDEAASSCGLGSKGSTESGYFSRSESTDVSQDSPPNTSAKTYAEVILGKFGRLGHLQRSARHQHEHSGGQETRTIPFTVPKKQVIDHITKLITINEAVVDTSKIDSVKPRRFSLSRRSSVESKASLSKETLLHSAKDIEISPKSSGSITLGVPCEKFQHHSLSISQPADLSSTVPLMRSHSLPLEASAASTASSRSLRLSQSFEEQQPAQSRRHGVLRRQPAIELPIGAEIATEEQLSSSSPLHLSVSTVPECKQKHLEPFECKACGIACNSWEKYKTHKHHQCLARLSQQLEIPACHAEEHGSLYKTRPGALAIRKRRKEESLELDDPTLSPVSIPSTFTPPQGSIATCEKSTIESIASSQVHDKESALKGVSVIQHTSLFDKQEPILRTQGAYEATKDKLLSCDLHQAFTDSHSKEQTAKPAFRKLVRQHNVQVPEILVTEDTNTNLPVSPDVSDIKETEKVGDFQWPQRSPTLAQLPIEKLPPKKKRLRLAEAAQSSGDSSFESLSLPHSPTQESSMSHTSSYSTSHEESVKNDVDRMSSRRSRAPHTLTIPTGPHQPHREMRRSASEQAPHVPQQTNPTIEARSKSFDYSCLSPDRTPAGWRERRKCLLLRHSVVREPEEEDPTPKPAPNVNSPSASTSISPRNGPDTTQSPGPSTSHNVSLGNTVRPSFSHTRASQWQLNQPPGVSENVLVGQNVPDNVLQVTTLVHTDPHTVMESPQCPSGAARAHYSSVSTGLKLEIPIEENVGESASSVHSAHLPHCLHYQHLHHNINPSQELLRPVGMQRVPVRLHSDLPCHASAVYTTLSQAVAARSQDTSCSGVRLDSTTSKFDFREQQSVSEGSKSCGSGGNKRVLSPTSSVEFSQESQQQKRVKEEEEEEEEEEEDKDNAKNSAESLIGSKTEGPMCAQSPVVPTCKKDASFPSLYTDLTFSWCYLNYIKPNPSAQSDNQNSVYSSWCISPRNPNPPGLTSKEVLSLLCCKQRQTSFTYTMAAMPPSVVEKPDVLDSRDPKVSEVHATQSTDSTEVQQAEQTEQEASPKRERGEEVLSTSTYDEVPRVQICEGGSSEEYVYVRGRGRGRYVCEECGIRCKKPSMLRKHIRLHTDARPYVCQHCNFAFKTKGNLTKHMKSKAHGQRCPEGTTPGPVLCELETEEGGGDGECAVVTAVAEEHQFSDADDADEEEDDDNEEAEEEASRSSASSASRSLSGEDRGPRTASRATAWARQPSSLSPAKPDRCRGVASPSTPALAGVSSSPIRSVSPGLHLSPALPRSPGRDPSPLRCLSPRLSLSPSPCQSSLSPSSQSVSPFSAKHPSPVRALSPMRPGSPSGPLSSVVGACVMVQHRAYRRRDAAKCSPNRFKPKAKLENTCSTQRRGCQPQSPPRGLVSRQGPAREGQRVLSHLPLHSQPLGVSAGLSLMIPIGGIQMVQSRSALQARRPGLNSPATQVTLLASGRERDARGSPPTEAQQRGPARAARNQTSVTCQSGEDKKREAPSAPLTTWKCISQRKERKRGAACRTIPLTHFHKGAPIRRNAQTPSDSVAVPKSSWSERASSISSNRENSLREKALAPVSGTNTGKVDRIP
ncbi:transcription factor HIVEP3 isoform X2 [Electrophorus electricus]|uniref:transcription factor HIVEP3 isoform X2 n=1 Tax=Electrophorus electricus TaxID=8005 RepID=UPI0015CFD218|nr:transcription factor HIVEP3 isoform X2 [Electrophorus electricus]